LGVLQTIENTVLAISRLKQTTTKGFLTGSSANIRFAERKLSVLGRFELSAAMPVCDMQLMCHVIDV
jgi:hypothetical protein